ncbi:MFS transporter [Bacteriovorax stolpii]|uniref:MFS transporter n=1 Tax=Bacteriovorax stolpii TaxID=960 RepID=A0A2K9NW11_BACTC|nr:MFS transporter [Bacteriovorax stolpii]AUN99709.1 MFS transporter [Bacteriovorax stolpii]QDK40294.1 MFS transporter [Bacteriovorax stolpii]TDP51342.1 putative MFS family arabinose efflux permease [Bacteriovorax stolpii]
MTTNQEETLSPLVLWLMTIATGVCVANLYYCQPLLHQMQETFNVTPGQMGAIPTLTQLGYAVGMLFLIPLGDQIEKRKLIFVSTLISALTLVGMTLSPNLLTATIMSFLIGVTTMTPQFIIPFAVHLAPAEKRGRVLGMVMSGLLLGILLARTVAGFVGAEYGWRFMFGLAAGVLVVLAIILRLVLPVSQPSYQGSYVKLIHSVWTLVKEQPVLRESMLFGSMLFGAFSAFWATLIYLMESPAFHLGARAVGLFGLLGAAGALTAPIIGRLSDKKSPRSAIMIGFILMALSFILYMTLGQNSLIALSIGVLLMDIGLQGSHVSNQSRVFSLIPEARSRLNTAYMFSYFLGGALGSWLGSISWGLYGWTGVCASALLMIAIGALPFVLERARKA